jgi:hypothetical protein
MKTNKIVDSLKVVLFIFVLILTTLSLFPRKSVAAGAELVTTDCPDGGTYCEVAYPGGILVLTGHHAAASLN